MEKITIKDVARICGVSPATVSRVMTDNNRISDETKEKVRKVIKELGYTPNFSARSLTNKNTNIIGVVIQSSNEDNLKNSFFIEMMTQISNLLIKQKYYLLYISCKDSKDEYKKIEQLVKSRRVDGFIFLTLKNTDKTLYYLTEIKFPFVVIGTPNDKKNILWVDNDNINATYEITKNLLNEKKENIIFLGGSRELNVTKYRYKGYEKAFLEFNKKINTNNILESEFDENYAYNKIKEYINDNNSKIDAIVTTDDILAVGSVKVLKEYGIESKVIGFNDSLIRKYTEPKFATVNINVEMLANSATELLMQKLKCIDIKQNFKIIETKYINEYE